MVNLKFRIVRLSSVLQRFVRQSGGRGQFGHVVIEIYPLEQGAGFEFVNEIKGGVIPQEYIPAVRKGLEEGITAGILGGYPLVDVGVRLYDGSYHPVDSSEIAFSNAARIALKDAVKRADPILLEPIMEIEVIAPDDYLGKVMGDLNARRAQIFQTDMHSKSGTQVIKAHVPLAEMFGYVKTLRSLTQGRAIYSMEFAHYNCVPQSIAQEIILSK